MSDLASLNIQIDSAIKNEADNIARAMGMTLSAAISVFVRRMVEARAMPFAVQVLKTENAELERIRQKRLSAKGSLKGKIRMSEDFNAPLEEMKDYME